MKLIRKDYARTPELRVSDENTKLDTGYTEMI